MLSNPERPAKPQSEPETAVAPTAGLVTVPAEVVALAAYVVAVQYVDPPALCALLIELGLAARVPFDPAVHGEFDDLLPGDPFTAFSAPLREALALGRPQLRAFAGKLN